MTWASDLAAHKRKVERVNRAVFVGIVDASHESIQLGSQITGAPGQPVRTGNLRNSWIKSFPDPWIAEITTNVVYAEDIEDGIRSSTGAELHLVSQVGGFHSVALTRLGFYSIVDDVTARVVGGVE